MSLRSNYIRTGILIGTMLFGAAVPSWARGQQDANPQTGGSQQAPSPEETGLQRGAQTTQQDSSTQSEITPPPPTTDVIDPIPIESPPPQTEIRGLGSASPLSALEGERWRWGPFHLGPSDARGVYNSIRPSDGEPASSDVLSLFSTEIIFDKEWRRSRIALQYQPRLAIAQHQVAFDYMNQNASFATYFELTPRWTLGVFDGFYYTNTDSLLGSLYADADAVSLVSVQNVVLDSAAKYLSDAGGVSFSYALTPRTYVSFSPGGGYTRTSGLSIGNGSTIARTSISASASITHVVSVRTTYGFEYTANYSQFTGNLPLSQYHSIGVTFVHQFTPTIGANIEAGATMALYSGQGRYTTWSGAASVFKSFQRSSISAIYSRGQNLQGFVTNHLGDRADLLYRQRLSMRLGVTASLGYQRELTNSIGAYGKYGEGEVSYDLSPSVAAFGDYVYKIQTGDNAQLFNGSRNFMSAGIRWSPVIAGR